MNDHTIRKFAVIAAAAALTAQSSIASAAECTFSFPTGQDDANGGPLECRQGSSAALVAHFLAASEGFSLFVDMTSGTLGAVAYGIDVNGNVLSTPTTTVADRDRRFNQFEAVPASDVYGDGVTGTIPNRIFYDHPIDMASTYVVVF